jgi:hypothetical protein
MMPEKNLEDDLMTKVKRFVDERFNGQENTIITVLSIVGLYCCYAIVCIVCRMKKSDDDDEEQIVDVPGFDAP